MRSKSLGANSGGEGEPNGPHVARWDRSVRHIEMRIDYRIASFVKEPPERPSVDGK